MKWMRSYRKTTACVTMLVFAITLILPELLCAQVANCGYDEANPSVENARKNFKITNYPCAEEELNLLLADKSLDLKDRADAHVLMASVYYAMMRDDGEKSRKVTEQFVEAFKAFRTWKGDVDIKSPEFLSMMEKARELVAKQNDAKKAAVDKIPEAELPSVSSDGKPWYKKWWAIGLGVGVVAVVAIAVGGGGSEETPPEDPTLPGFPGTPTR
jgi:hypothetical protein